MFPGHNGHVQVAKIQIGYKTEVRPVSKCVLLESNEYYEKNTLCHLEVDSQKGQNAQKTLLELNKRM